LLLAIRQRADDLEPDRVAQSMQHVGQGNLIRARVMEGPHTVIRRVAKYRSESQGLKREIAPIALDLLRGAAADPSFGPIQ
jgi:hypothetical protein